MKNELDIFEATPENIWNYRQNHPELVIKDCRKRGIPETALQTIRQSMLCRGINKWLKVRRDLISYKKLIKHEIKELDGNTTELKRRMTEKYTHPKQVGLEKTVWDYAEYTDLRTKYIVNKELLKYKMKVRGDLKKMCMSDRWQIWENKKMEDMNTIKASD